MKIPTMTRMMTVYLDAAKIEQLKCGKPSKRTIRNTIGGLKAFRVWLNERREKLGYSRIDLDEDFPLVSIIKPKLIHQYLADMLKKGVKPITAIGYMNQLRQLFARWVLPYYQDHGWKIPTFPSLGGRPAIPRYNRPPKEQLEKVKKWYEGLETNELWFVTTMMLEFGMRNSDILRLKRENFIEWDGRVYLNYVPNKTKYSSGRVVKWPVHPEIWKRIENVDFNYDDEIFKGLNKIMRGLGFKGTKGAYELRKICIDHVYQKYGAEMATSISGDDIRTIIRYYADPAQPNIGAVRVLDLI